MKHTEAEKLFLDKMAVLNKAFLYFIQCSLKEMPDGDLVVISFNFTFFHEQSFELILFHL